MSLAEFDREFRSKVGEDRRWAGFKLIAYYLLAKQEPVHIVETGCARQVDNWCGDGQSTQVWNWIVERTGGSIHTTSPTESSRPPTILLNWLRSTLGSVQAASLLWMTVWATRRGSIASWQRG